MRFEGSVEEVLFRNDENGYSVVRMSIASLDGVQTCVGYFPLVIAGESLIIEGEWTYNKIFGKQIQVKSAQIELPSTEDAMIKYLSSGLFRGVGVKLATKIVNKYKDKTFEVIEFAPSVLSTIKTISYNKAVEIAASFKEHKKLQAVIMYLQAYDISINLALKLYKIYGTKVQMVLEKNPYQLIKDVDGIGFLKADAIALKLGIQEDSEFRISAAIQYALLQNATRNGHTYMDYDLLVQATMDVLKLNVIDPTDLIKNIIRLCEQENSIVLLDDNKVVMSSYFYNLEKSISRKVISMLNNSTNIFLTDLDLDIKTFQMKEKITLHEKQIDAIKNAIQYGVSIITGGPGTGKTTIIKAILDILLSMGKKVVLCAPTGRAAKRLEEATGYEAKTIHRLLKLNFDTGSPQFEYNESQPLEADVIICDEISMCDEQLYFALLSAMKPNSRFVMLGDKDQLPSVGAGNVLMDLINSELVPISYLSHIFRQGEDSKIIINAHEINKGIVPKLDNKNKDFFFIEELDQDKVIQCVIDLIKTRLPKTYGFKPQDIQVLSPIKRSLCGVENLNNKIQAAINKLDGEEINKNDYKFRVKDRVIHVENNYSLQWTNEKEISVGQGVFNGEMGFIKEVNAKAKKMIVEFDDGKVVKYSNEDISQLNLAYAISVHKSQGSEFKAVVMVIPGTFMPIMTRNLLYTGITRAKEMVIVVGSKDNFIRTIYNNDIARRNSKLMQFLKEEAEFSLDRESAVLDTI